MSDLEQQAQELIDAEDRLLDALYRHMLAAAAGEKTDPESAHAAHAAWNALALLELEIRKG